MSQGGAVAPAGPSNSDRQGSAVPIKVLIAQDREHRGRGQFWREEFLQYNATEPGKFQPVADPPVTVHVADDVARRQDSPGKFFLEHLAEANVLIVNWDMANGDPDFGADVAQRWFASHQHNLLTWVQDGGVLVVEGQANMNIPVQAAYEGILGAGEVALCGPESRLDTAASSNRQGRRCRLTRAGRRSKLFEKLWFDEVTPTRRRTWTDMFLPEAPERDLPSHLRTGDWELAWRGWFRRPFTGRRFSWVPVMRTAGLGWSNHVTMLVTAYGSGAIFVTTMYLTLGQPRLTEVFLSCYNHPERLPQRPRMTELVGRHGSYVAPLLGAALLIAWPFVFGGGAPDALEAVISLVLAVAGGLRFLYSRTARPVRNLVGL